MKKGLFCLMFIAVNYMLIAFNSGCAQIGMPTGGATDTIAPILAKASPQLEQTNFSGNKITLTFNEYIELKDLQANLMVSPLPKVVPTITSNLRTVTIKIRDTLQPNTTYSYNFGNAIADVNESNVVKNFVYTFSTGPFIDSLELKGNVLLAENGKADSTIQILLYRNATDSAIEKVRPDFISRVDGSGNFSFRNLPGASFKVYALKDNDGNKYYNSKGELFAFLKNDINTADTNVSIKLLAYVEDKSAVNTPVGSSARRPAEKQLKYSSSLAASFQDLLSPLQITFNGGLETARIADLVITDSNYRKLPDVIATLDSSRSIISFAVNWIPETDYRLIIPKEALSDSAKNVLAKSDTLKFTTRKISDYGKVQLRFRNLDLSRNPVLQLVQSEVIKEAHSIRSNEWNKKLVTPGEYEIRILFDTNNDGNYTTGSYKLKRQPEQVVPFGKPLAVKADWENEMEIEVQ